MVRIQIENQSTASTDRQTSTFLFLFRLFVCLCKFLTLPFILNKFNSREWSILIYWFWCFCPKHFEQLIWSQQILLFAKKVNQENLKNFSLKFEVWWLDCGLVEGRTQRRSEPSKLSKSVHSRAITLRIESCEFRWSTLGTTKSSIFRSEFESKKK
jgi:hypothetical protein